MDMQQEVEKLEKELYDIIVKHLEDNTMNTEGAQKLAADFMALLPPKDKKDLLEKLKELAVQHTETQPLYIQELKTEEILRRDNTLNKMRDAIQKGDINTAVVVAKTAEEG